MQKRITEHGQEHVLNFWDEITDEQQGEFKQQLTNIDFELLGKLQTQTGKNDIGQLDPSPVVKLDENQRQKGIEAIENGELAVLTVAGGQGTRLGWSGPKGTFPATPITGKSLFQIIAEQIIFASKKYNVSIPWYIMTSNENDAATRSFLLDNNCFGIDRTDIFVFSQGEMPAVDTDGKILLASKSKVAMNPDGHGGVIVALKNSGALEEMQAKGVKYLSYVQIDNPLAHVIDPDFLGIHLSETSSIEVTSKCILKSSSEERVGVFCLVGGKTTIVEYSDLPEQLAEEVDEQGTLRYFAGSIAIHLMSTEFLQRIADDLPWHKANKIVPHIDVKTGESVVPTNPNGYKFERFVFDVLPFAKHSLVVETKREEEFAPIKNATGCDSAKTSHILQKDRAVRWLKMNNVEVSESATVEISPLVAASQDDLVQIELPLSISTDEIVVI
jgi:UDP-N-acetylglucosamine/UDP-N-acetylgalactosamine diphosphorylase